MEIPQNFKFTTAKDTKNIKINKLTKVKSPADDFKAMNDEISSIDLNNEDTIDVNDKHDIQVGDPLI